MIPTGIGGDFLGAAFFTKEAITASEVGDAFGLMPETFTGKKDAGWKAAEAFGACGKFFEGVIHLTPFDYSHRYPVKKLMPLLRKNTLRVEVLANKYPHQIWMISLFCEHNHPRSVMEPLYRELRQIAPSCLFVNSIWKGEEVPGMITEIHLTSFKTAPREPRLEYIISFDGFGGDKDHPGDMPDTDVGTLLAKYPRRRHVRGWGSRMNGKFNAYPKPEDPPVPPPNQRKYWPDVPYLRGYRASLTPRQGSVTWGKNALLKPFADDHGAGGKDNKLMVILPRGANTAEVIDSKGKVIDKLSTMGLPPHTGDPQGPRFYSKLAAVDVGDIALRNTGSRVVTVRCGKDTYPPTDVVLRSGKFRIQ